MKEGSRREDEKFSSLPKLPSPITNKKENKGNNLSLINERNLFLSLFSKQQQQQKSKIPIEARNSRNSFPSQAWLLGPRHKAISFGLILELNFLRNSDDYGGLARIPGILEGILSNSEVGNLFVSLATS